VDHGDAFLDTHSLERARGITIFSKQARLATENLDITLVDTPGHVDFSPEMERSLPVLDCAVLVISGSSGIQAHTMTLWRLLEKYHVPTFLFINKMDLPGLEREKLMQQLQEQLSAGCVDFGADFDTHYKNLMGLLRSVREEFAVPQLPFVAGDFVQHWKNSSPEITAQCLPVVNAMRRICADMGGEFVESDGLISNAQNPKRPDDGFLVDIIHFCRESVHELGHRYFAGWQKIAKSD
jgi:small GTP-binding protein